MKYLHFASFALALVMAVFGGCQNEGSKGHEDGAAHHDHAGEDHAHIYVCPMHPEVVSDKPGECPKCHMALEEQHADAPKKVYEMRFSTQGSAVAGGEVTLIFTPKVKGDDSAVVPLDVQHGKKVHLIVTSDDLAFFDHIHPEIQADGSYVVKTTFPAGGKYWLFADYKPTGADHQLEKIAIEVSGKPLTAKTWAPRQTTTTSDGYTISLTSEIGKFVDGGETHIVVKIMKDGEELKVSALENYLGAKSHAVLISTDAEKRYLHLHPGVEDDRLHLAASFGQVGAYRAWLQFKHAGKVQTADFVIPVVAGMGESPAHGHDHEGHSHEGHSHEGHNH